MFDVDVRQRKIGTRTTAAGTTTTGLIGGAVDYTRSRCSIRISSSSISTAAGGRGSIRNAAAAAAAQQQQQLAAAQKKMVAAVVTAARDTRPEPGQVAVRVSLINLLKI